LVVDHNHFIIPEDGDSVFHRNLYVACFTRCGTTADNLKIQVPTIKKNSIIRSNEIEKVVWRNTSSGRNFFVEVFLLAKIVNDLNKYNVLYLAL
jgi:hypothetical protein